MLNLATLSTFLAVALGIWGAYLHLRRDRRAVALVTQRDPGEQEATVIRTTPLWDTWALRARQAGFNWTGRTYVMAGAIGLCLATVTHLGGQPLLALLLAGLGFAGPFVLVEYRRGQRTEMFARQLPDALTLAANTVRSGGTLLQAIRAVARECPDPLRTEFKRAEQAVLLQVPAHTALEQVHQRAGCREFLPVVVASKVATRAGADMDIVFDSIAREILANRQHLQAMRTASSEGRTSAYVVTGIPVVFVGAVTLMSPDYFGPILASLMGRVLMGGCALIITLGVVMIRRMVDVRTW